MDPTLQLVLATAAFLATHFVSSTPLRASLAGALGEGAYLGLYSLAAFATIGWMVYAYNHAPTEPLWPGLRHVPAAVMPFAFIFIVSGVLSKNPTAVGQGKLLAQDDPARGILRITRHPVQWGILLWAGSHVLARGNLKSLIFFGGFLLLSAVGTRLIDARKAREGGEHWQRFAARTSNVPFLAILQGRNQFVFRDVTGAKLVFGLIAYGGMMVLHPMLFGARPW